MALSEIDLDALSPSDALAALEAAGEKRAIEGLGGKVVWRVWGAGEPLVLLHGGYGTWAHWVRVIQPLARHHRLLVPDMPGFGESDDAPPAEEPEGRARRIAESLRLSLESLLGSGERPTICGFSFGGVISGHLAKQLGPRCRLLVLTAPGGLGARRGPMPDLIRRTPGMTPQEVEAAHRRNLEILMLAEPTRVDSLALHIQRGNTEQHRVKSRPISATGTLARSLEGAPYPVKAIWGERDATAGPYMGERLEILERAAPGAEVLLEPGAGHWIMYEMPERYVELLESLLQR